MSTLVIKISGAFSGGTGDGATTLDKQYQDTSSPSGTVANKVTYNITTSWAALTIPAAIATLGMVYGKNLGSGTVQFSADSGGANPCMEIDAGDPICFRAVSNTIYAATTSGTATIELCLHAV